MLDVLVYVVGGIFGGVITGLIGLSAVDTIAPLLVVFLGYDVYTAISLSLSSDVFSSLASTYVFNRNGRVRWKYAFLLVFFSLFGIVAGSFLAKITPSFYLSFLVSVGIISAGIRIMKTKELKKKVNKSRILVFVSSLIVGFIAGYFGAGGGLMILTLLVVLFGFRIHDAVGTSVLAMSFIAFFGAVFHYVNEPFSFYPLLFLGPSSFISAYVTSLYANKIDEKKLSKIAGYIIVVLGVLMLIKEFVFSFSKKMF